MAKNDPFTTAAFGVADTNAFIVDGSDSATGAAIISGLAGNADAEVRLDAFDGNSSSWTAIAQLKDDGGNTTFAADWHTQFNRVLVNGGGSPSAADQRLRITNVSGGAGDFSADGDER